MSKLIDSASGATSQFVSWLIAVTIETWDDHTDGEWNR